MGAQNRTDQTCHRNGQLTFVARHPVLSDIARTMAGYDLPAGLTSAAPIIIYVGSHRFSNRILPRGLKIGIQTEHFLDDHGRALWWKARRWRLLRQVLKFDMLVDLSAANAPVYQFLPGFLARKVVFGPYIFPDQLPDFTPGGESGDAPVAFFGALNPHRQARLEAIGQSLRVQVLPEGCFGPDLHRHLAPAKAVLNLHFADGKYTEYPRLLSALLAGKALISDPLGRGLQRGVHYLDPTDPVDDDALRHVHANAVRFASRWRFSDLLRRFAEQKQLLAPGWSPCVKTSG